ncbi:MAG TPA: PqqD family protein [Solirubrobacteraceae bacterium]|jgi:hypothetical protein|nr:PqqD family protein [Solirubrobacteraceae bacterium]
MHEHGSLPRARQDGLLEETVGEELLLYDQESHTAHCLSPIAACIWRHCDGQRDATELSELAGASESLVADALQELREKDLLAGEPSLTQSAVPGVSRREAIGRMARVGAAAAGASLIVSATAATPAMAESTKGLCRSAPNSGLNCCMCAGGECTVTQANETACRGWCGMSMRGGFASWNVNYECL